MSDLPPANSKGMSQALGRLPSGLFILTGRDGERTNGMLASWVQQAGFEPPMITVAVQRDRPMSALMESTRRFVLCQIAAGNKHLLRHFSRGFPPDAPVFEGIELGPEIAGGPVLAESLAYLDAEVAGHLDSGDHRIYLARVVGGEVLDTDAQPMIHVRREGSHY